MSPPTRPFMGVLLIVCAMSGPAETAKPVATLEAMNPRRENLTFGSRLSNSGLVGVRSFIEFLRRGCCRWAGGALGRTDSASFLFPGRATRRARATARPRTRAKQRPAARRADPARLLDLDLPFHRRVQAADVIEEPCLIELEGGALPPEQYARLAPRDRDLMRRVVDVHPVDRLPRRHGDLPRPE